MSAAVTIIRSTSPPMLCKQYSKVGGKLQKRAVAHVTAGTCRTLPTATAQDMVLVLSKVTNSTDLCVVPGVWRGADAEPFELVTEEALLGLVGEQKGKVEGGVHHIGQRRVGARLKRGIDPSAWMLIDADNPPGIPDAWAAKTLAERLVMMEPLIPGISRCERIELRGSSARVVNGSGQAGQATHAWMRVNRPNQIETLREFVCVDMVNQGLAFPSPRYSRAEPGKVTGNEQRTVIDLSVWTTGRIVFNARPNLGAGMDAYTVADAGIVIVNEGAGELDISGVTLPNRSALHAYRERTGVNLTMKAEGGVPRVVSEGQLTMDTEIVSRGKSKPLREWIKEMPVGGKLRCEAPFRASESEAAVLRLCDDGMPVVHDVGNGTTYELAARIWPAPTEIKADLPPAPPFDADALLPKPLREFVLDEADRMPCSPDYVAAALIVALGSVIGARCAIKPKRRDDWIVTPNLFGGVVGNPSSKKSPGIGPVIRFVDRLEAKEVEKLAERKRVHEAEMAAFAARQAAIQQAMRKAASGKGDAVSMDRAVSDLQDLQPPEEPIERRFKTNDGTVAKIGDLLVHNPTGLLVFRDELMGLLSSWDREGNEGDRAFYLEGWNGTGSFNIDRIGRGSQFVKNLCLSIFGGIQPDLLERYLDNIVNSIDNDGRIQRFQVLVYPDPVAWEWRDRYPVKGAREAVRDLFDRLADFAPVQDGATPADDFVKLPYFSFDDAAQEVFIEWDTELQTVLIPREQNPLMSQHLAKFEKLFCALALVLHLAEGRIGPVQVDTALRAAAWCQYLAGHARRIYGLSEVAKVTTAKMLGRRLAEGKLLDRFTARDVSRKGWTGLFTSGQIESALAILQEHAWVQGDDLDDHLGRPTTRFYVNPAIRR